MSRKFSLVALALAAGLVAGACSDQPLTSPDALSVSPNFDANPVIERVSVGSNDACAAFGLPNGCDGNYSLHAHLRADGSVTGQWEDVLNFGGPGGIMGVHLVIDCLVIVGNQAWVSGFVTTPGFVGIPAITTVKDNGAGANAPPDQISFTQFGNATSCTTTPNLPLLNLTTGQVTVK